MDPHSSPQSSPRGSISISASAPPPPQVDAWTELATLKAQMQHVFAVQQQQQSATASVPHAPPAPRLPKIRQPSSYSGAGGHAVDDWIVEMQQQFTYYGANFASDADRIRFSIAHLAGPAMHWWEHVPAEQYPSTWDEFVTLLRGRYRPVHAAMLARQRLGKLRMGPHHSVNQYTSVFQTTLTPITDMGETDQVHHYMQGLQPYLAAKVWGRHPTTLRTAIESAVSEEAMANFGRAAMPQRTNFGGHNRYHGASSSSSTSVPMDINSVESFLTEEVEQPSPSADSAMSAVLAKMEAMQQTINALQHGGGSSSSSFRRDGDRVSGLKPGDIASLMAEGKCFRCKKKGHMKNECPERSKAKNA